MTKIIVDGAEVGCAAGILRLLQACEAAGKEIPRFCYHERLSVAGNCWMRLVESEGGPPKPQAPRGPRRSGSASRPERALTAGACPAKTLMVKKAREGVTEIPLINYFVDRPIPAIRAANATCRIRPWPTAAVPLLHAPQ